MIVRTSGLPTVAKKTKNVLHLLASTIGRAFAILAHVGELVRVARH